MTTREPSAVSATANNNPGNIRANPHFTWRGQRGVDSRGFVDFRSVGYGLRAIARIWMTYRHQHGASTLRDYISRWAPPAENDTETYLSFVAMRVGVHPDLPIDISDLSLPLMRAVIAFEGTGVDVSDDEIKSAVMSAHII